MGGDNKKDEKPKKKKVKLSFAEDFVLAGLAAAVSKTAAAPIERVKLLVQNQDEMIKQGRLSHPYKGVMDCVSRVMAEEGIQPFWRGNMANVLRYFPTQALNFAIKPIIKALFTEDKNASYAKQLGVNITSGGVAGSISLLFVYSLDYARTRLANDNKAAKKGAAAGAPQGERQFNGLIDVYRKTIATDGVAGLYRGFVISCVGIFIYRGAYFGFFDTLKPMLGDNASGIATFALGYGVTVVSGVLSYPIDTIRRRMMMTSGTGVNYSSSMHCATEIMKAEGVMSFFKGAGANILRGVAGAGVLAGFDQFQAAYIAYAYPESA